MSAINNVISKVRYDVDELKSHYKAYTYNSSNEFDLPETNTHSISKITVNGAEISASKYTYDSTNQDVTIDESELSSNSAVIIYYTYYDYSDSELNGYIIRALGQLSINKYRKNGEFFRVDDLDNPTEIYPTPDEGEENLIAFIIGIFIRPSFSEYRVPLVSLRFPKTEDMDTKIRKVIERFRGSSGFTTALDL